MKKMKVRKYRKKSRVIMVVVALVFFFTIGLFNLYGHISSDKIVSITKVKLREFMESFLSNNIGYDILNKTDLEDILVINKNSDGEILYVDYDLDQAYNTLDIVTKKLNALITQLENGSFDMPGNRNVLATNNGIVLTVPFFAGSKNILLANLGPDIYVPVNFVGSILTNIKSKITNYGLNNALVELYVTIKVTSNLISPVSADDLAIEYDVLVASKVINGRVPQIYGGAIVEKSNLLSIPIEN